MSKLLRAFGAALFVFLNISNSTSAQALEFTPPDKQDASESYRATQSGGFSYSIDFETPAFRGLVPGLGLDYSSSRNARSHSMDVVGTGWKLKGFSEIERVSQKFGTPTFRDADDIFMLDGQPLMACTLSNKTPWPGAYPARFKSDHQSASCLANGNFSTIRESDRKIVKSGSTWTIYSKDGTRYIYKSLKTLSGHTPSPGSGLDKLMTNKWLLAEIRDTQQSANVVTISYYFAGDYGWAYRPAKVEYAGYKVLYGYENTDLPMSQWATGAGGLGQQTRRLISVRVYNDSSKIRAYKLSYSASPEVGTTRLAQVQQYGRNFGNRGSVITGGATLAAPYKMTYESDALGFDEVRYPNQDLPPNPRIWDIDNDGADELLFHTLRYPDALCYNGDNADPRRVPGPEILGKFLEVDAERDISSFSIPAELREAFYEDTGASEGVHYPTGFVLHGDGRFQQKDPIYLDGRTHRYFYGGSNNGYDRTDYYLRGVSVNGSSAELGNELKSSGEGGVAYGNFDLDPASEVVFGHYVYNLNGRNIEGTGIARPHVRFRSFDIDGDGMTDNLTSDMNANRNWDLLRPQHRATPSWYTASIPNRALGIESRSNLRRTSYHFSDVNGDGRDDLVMYVVHAGQGDEVFVSLSHGNYFDPRQRWLGAGNLPDLHPGSSPSGIRVRDVNSDGLGDLVFTINDAVGGQNCQGSFDPYTLGRYVKVFLSNGTSFQSANATSSVVTTAFTKMGDFDGDGALDFAEAGASGTIHFGRSR
ncbi:FG-GAP repeat domain-containing protein, partial [Tritonibacter sp. SIMBA_163]|uniref:FG-GAP repeat domain-containing protein n=1 Tax=Tritonibacter sp. SIMBA_163 TaxID=3080868 RepID=UPI00397F86E9